MLNLGSASCISKDQCVKVNPKIQNPAIRVHYTEDFKNKDCHQLLTHQFFMLNACKGLCVCAYIITIGRKNKSYRFGTKE